MRFVNSVSCWLTLAAAAWVGAYHEAFSQWYIREDSRFRATGFFSVYDIWNWFSTAQNSMGQYRPLTKVFWAVPHWLGLGEPFYYHFITAALIGAGAVALALYLHRVLGVEAALAGVAGGVFALLPVHGKPIYWLSAWHNPAVAAFAMASLYARALWHEGRVPRWVSLLAYVFAIGSRESGLLMVAPLLWLDFSRGHLRRSGDVVAVFVFFGCFLYLWNSPLGKVPVQGADLWPDLDSLQRFWRYLVATALLWNDSPYRPGDLGWRLAFGALSGIFLLVSLLRRGREAATMVVLGLAGIALLVVYRADWNPEYAVLLALGLSGVWAQGLDALFAGLGGRWRKAACVAAALGWLGLAAVGAQRTAQGYELYLVEGATNRALAEQLRLLDQSQPRGVAFDIVAAPPFMEMPGRRSNHWLPEGVEEVAPGRLTRFVRGSSLLSFSAPHQLVFPTPYGSDPIPALRLQFNGEKRLVSAP